MYIEFPLIGLVTLAAIIDLRSRRIPNLLIVAGLIAALWANADRKSTRLNSSHIQKSRMPSSA